MSLSLCQYIYFCLSVSASLTHFACFSLSLFWKLFFMKLVLYYSINSFNKQMLLSNFIWCQQRPVSWDRWIQGRMQPLLQGGGAVLDWTGGPAGFTGTLHSTGGKEVLKATNGPNFKFWDSLGVTGPPKFPRGCPLRHPDHGQWP